MTICVSSSLYLSPSRSDQQHNESHGHSRSSRSHHRHSSSRHHSSSRTGHASRSTPHLSPHDERLENSCWGCKASLSINKSLCDHCFSKVANERGGVDKHLEALVKRVVDKSLQERDTIIQQDSPIDPMIPLLDQGHLHEVFAATQASQSAASPSESGSELEDTVIGFDYALVPALVKAIKETLNLEDPATSPPKQRKLFKQLNKERHYFPFITEIGAIISNEWSKPDKKGSMQSKITKLYPFKQEDVTHLEAAPSVDAALMRLVKYVTLPLEDTVSFKDPLERRIDSDLKRIYLTAGSACKPILAIAAASKALEAWSDSVNDSLRSISEDTAKNSPIQEIRLASAFLGEASIDITRLVARVMLSAVTARRALWLRPWSADAASKQAWCRIPFEGGSLFGNKLDSAISRATGGKSGFLPQDRRLQNQKRTFFRPQITDRWRDARNYRPGREFSRPWRSRQPPFKKQTKGTTSNSQESTKSF